MYRLGQVESFSLRAKATAECAILTSFLQLKTSKFNKETNVSFLKHLKSLVISNNASKMCRLGLILIRFQN